MAYSRASAVPGVYSIRHVSGRMYIGSAADVRRRFAHHRRQLRLGIHTNSALQAAFNSDGPTAFQWTVVEQIDGLAAMREREREILTATDPADLFNETTLVPVAGKRFWSKLTEDQAAEIHRRLAALEMAKTLAREFNVHPTTINRIRRGSNWGFGRLPDGRSVASRKRKLGRDEVLAIRARADAGERTANIAADFGIGSCMVRCIARRAAYPHL